MIQIAVLGYGTVGRGVVEVIETNKSLVSRKAGEELQVKYILDLREFPGDPYEAKVIHDFETIVQDEEVAVVCETMGGVGAAYEFTKRTLAAGKSVCTSNKELVAAHGPELIALAEENACHYMFEASVGGGIPVIRTMNNALTAEKVEAITGILNGTTNYILSKMENEGADFDAVLKKAQEKGYAEKNPEADIEGHDACRKIAILSSLMLGKNVDYRKIYTEGITKVTASDFVFARKLGMSIKLLAMSKVMANGKAMAMVAPCLINADHPLHMVNGVFNAVFVQSNMLGDSMYYGKGAGKLPTASAVVGDVIDCVRHKGESAMCLWSDQEAELVSIDEVERRFYIRANASLESSLREEFGNIEPVRVELMEDEFAFLTDVMREKEFTDRCAMLKSGILSRFRVEE